MKSNSIDPLKWHSALRLLSLEKTPFFFPVMGLEIKNPQIFLQEVRKNIRQSYTKGSAYDHQKMMSSFFTDIQKIDRSFNKDNFTDWLLHTYIDSGEDREKLYEMKSILQKLPLMEKNSLLQGINQQKVIHLVSLAKQYQKKLKLNIETESQLYTMLGIPHSDWDITLYKREAEENTTQKVFLQLLQYIGAPANSMFYKWVKSHLSDHLSFEKELIWINSLRKITPQKNLLLEELSLSQKDKRIIRKIVTASIKELDNFSIYLLNPPTNATIIEQSYADKMPMYPVYMVEEIIENRTLQKFFEEVKQTLNTEEEKQFLEWTKSVCSRC
jgi:hypothetical protein